MDWRATDRPHNHQNSPTSYPSQFNQPTAQPPVQIPFSDPFTAARDPFLPGNRERRGSLGPPSRAWPSTAAVQAVGPLPPHSSSHLPPSGPPPPPAQNGIVHAMPMPFDPTRRRSLDATGNAPHLSAGPLGPPPPPPPPPFFSSRNMPPPSPPQMPPPSASQLTSAPRGPPTTSPFPGVRDLASLPSHRSHASSMPLSSILAGNEERRVTSSPHTVAAGPTSTPKMMQPPSPGRARSSSMREGLGRRETSPNRVNLLVEPRAQTTVHERLGGDTRREPFLSPRFQRDSPHSFRAFRPEQQESRLPRNGNLAIGRPSSQPSETPAPRSVFALPREPTANTSLLAGARPEARSVELDGPFEGRFGAFRQYAEEDRTPRNDVHPFPNGITSQPRQSDVYGSPQLDRDGRPPYVMSATHASSLQEPQPGLFRQYAPETARESTEVRPTHDSHREEPRSSPPLSDLPPYLRARNGFIDRPMTFDEHHRITMAPREQQQRKESDGSTHRSLLNISPELNRKGRNSPLPQAVQGAQPRHVGPGGDNPGIKMEFGRMFSGLGSGVGSTTPTAAQSVNGATTPSRLMSPAHHLEDGDLVRTAVAGIENGKPATKPRGSRKTVRRSTNESEKLEADGQALADAQRGSKRAKTSHPAPPHHHHHHHHHHETNDTQMGGFNMLRFPSNSSLPASTAHHHHHHHHHATHGHPPHHHHHHHVPKSGPALPKPTVTVINKSILEQVAQKPRMHLGSQVYKSDISQLCSVELAPDPVLKFNVEMKPIPVFEGNENCTYTIRIPRSYLTSSRDSTDGGEASLFAAICRRRQVWGTDIYTDDSDVLAAAVHSGWIKGDFGELDDDIRDVCNGEAASCEEQLAFTAADLPVTVSNHPSTPIRIPPDTDLHITILVLPPLEAYASSLQHHLRSREWTRTQHDGMSFMIHRLDFVDESDTNRFVERGIKARKERLAKEEARRREAAAGLLGLFANGGRMGGGAVRVGA